MAMKRFARWVKKKPATGSSVAKVPSSEVSKEVREVPHEPLSLETVPSSRIENDININDIQTVQPSATNEHNRSSQDDDFNAGEVAHFLVSPEDCKLCIANTSRHINTECTGSLPAITSGEELTSDACANSEIVNMSAVNEIHEKYANVVSVQERRILHKKIKSGHVTMTEKKKNKHFESVSKYLKSKSQLKSEPSNSFFQSPVQSTPDVREQLQYSTWPAEQLHSTVWNLIEVQSGFKDLETISTIEKAVERELNNLCPFEDKEQYDFCIICPHDDCHQALQLKEKMCTEYNVMGCVLWEYISLGEDLCTAFEELLSRSTKAIFYITENFNEYDYCSHLAKNYAMGQDPGSVRKVIPVFKNTTIKIPDGFQLLDRIVLTNEPQFHFRFSAIFSNEAKQKKISRKYFYERDIDNKRKLLLNKLVIEKVNQENALVKSQVKIENL